MTSRIPTITALLALGGASLMAASGNAVAHPAIRGIWPDAGVRYMYVTITGANLADAPRVSIGSVAGTFRISGNTLRARFPTLAVSGHVTVETPEGTAVSRGRVEGPFFAGLIP